MTDTSPRPLATAAAIIDRSCGSMQALERTFLARWVGGDHPHLRHIEVDRSLAINDLLVDGASLISSIEGAMVTTAVIQGAGFELFASSTTKHTTLRLTAASLHRLRAIDSMLKPILEVSPRPDEITLPVRSRDSAWQHQVTVPEWSTVAHNYPAAVSRKLDELMRRDPPTNAGRLVLWHGPPGTGKTTAIRSLLRSWSGWCDPLYVMDPERLFTDTDYLSMVLTTASSSMVGPRLDRAGHTADRWRLVIAEDADEFLRSSARHEAGAALGRLLNVTDGLLGDRMQALVLITTNAEVRRLHPALVRPGRCLAEVEFPAFPAAEAARWLQRPVAHPMTLAELLAERGDLEAEQNASASSLRTGVYL